MSVKAYIKEKEQLLKHFAVLLTAEQQHHIRNLPSEIAVDNYARTLIVEQLEAETTNRLPKRGGIDTHRRRLLRLINSSL